MALDQDYNYSVGEIYDPFLRKNVYMGGMSPAQYIIDNWKNYNSYEGPVTHVGSTPIHKEAFTGARPQPKNKKQPVNIDRGQGRAAYEQSILDPGNAAAQQQLNTFISDTAQNVRVVPGARPDVGFYPGLGGVNLRTMTPLDWEDKPRLDDVERMLLKVAEDHNFNFPTLRSLTWDKGFNPAEMMGGRGFSYRGDASPEEAQMTERLLGGNPIDLNRFAQLRGSRVQRDQRPKWMRDATRAASIGIPALASMIAPIAAPGFAGAAVGAGFGALNAGGQSKWKNPAAVGLGAAGGFAGGWGAGAGAVAAGAGPVLTGAASGAGGATGANVGQSIGTGQWDPEKYARDILISGAAGAGTGAIAPPGPPSVPGGRPTPNPFAPPINTGFRNVGNEIYDSLNPRRKRNPLNPYSN